MKKFLVALALIAVVIAVFAVSVSAEGEFYSLVEAESGKVEGMQLEEDAKYSGGKSVYDDHADSFDPDERNYFEVTVNVPEKGNYAIWIRAYVMIGADDQATLYHRSNSAVRNSISAEGNPFWKMVGQNDTPKFIWYPLDARMKNNADPVLTKTAELEAGDNIISLSVRSVSSWSLTHEYDCLLITNNMDYDPNTDDGRTAGLEIIIPEDDTTEEATEPAVVTTEPADDTEEKTDDTTAAADGTSAASDSADTDSQTDAVSDGKSPLVPIIIAAAVAVVVVAAVILVIRSKKAK